ncbi:smd1 [[Candida] subhashii]|uniref:Smd1 n=1 Tax=[Candida] subhashii TaxID=561895 RepID=A0A8J5UXU9_9ASCO|nr:smd1 [[Candida] subhashii]KAG7663875.1 smd1 [[Candida] subhashii]
MNIPNSTNQPITVELKNGTSITGNLLSCSPTMNLSLKNVKLQQQFQDPSLLNYINIRGNQIRQIILPDQLNIDSILTKCATNNKIKGHGAGPAAAAGGGATGGGNIRKPFKPKSQQGRRSRPI